MEWITDLVGSLGLPQWAIVAAAAAVAFVKRQDLGAWIKFLVSGGKGPLPIVAWDMDDIHDVLRRVLEEMIAKVGGDDPRWQQVADKIAEALALVIDIKRTPLPPAAVPKKLTK